MAAAVKRLVKTVRAGIIRIKNNNKNVSSDNTNKLLKKGNSRKRCCLAVPAVWEGLRSALVQDPYNNGVGEKGGAVAEGVDGKEDSGVGGDKGGSDE